MPHEKPDSTGEQAAEYEISRSDLRKQASVYFIGLMAARSLETFGQVTLIMSDDDKVAIANPVHVYLDAGAFIGDEKMAKAPNYHWVRPVLGQGKPQYCAWRSGELWEIEFDEEPETPIGS